MTESAVIQVEGVWKRYGLPLLPAIKRGVMGMLAPGTPIKEPPWALQGIAFSVQPGETLGIIGRNGAGKSTLLKVLAGVSPLTRGRVRVEGTLFPMIELNAGIHMELTGRENVRLLGAVMGLSHREVARRMPAIEAFCELGEWFDRPVRMYSSGMLVRLGFAVGAHVEAEVLLMDEVMAVGDINFYNKCLRYLEETRAQGCATLFVSHNLQRIRRLCDKVLVLDRGRQAFWGETETGIQVYEELIRQPILTGDGQTIRTFDYVGLSLPQTRFLNPAGEPLEAIAQGEDLVLEFTLAASRPVAPAQINVALESSDAVDMVISTLRLDEIPVGENHFRVHWRQLRMKAGVYHLRIGVAAGEYQNKGFRASHLLTLVVRGDTLHPALYQPEFQFQRLEPPAGAANP